MDTHIESVNEEVIPDLAGELVTAYDAQDVAIKEKQQLIKHTHEEIARETVHSRELESELASTNRKIYCAVEENKGHEAKCAELQEELNLMVKRKLDTVQLLNNLKHKLLEKKRTFQVYADKIEEYNRCTEIVKRKSSEYKLLEKAKIEFENTNKEIQKRNEVNWNEKVEELKRKLVAEENRQVELRARKSNLDQLTVEREKKLESIEKEKEVYVKRNQAQLIRMKRQLQESNSSLEKKAEQVRQLTRYRNQLRGHQEDKNS